MPPSRTRRISAPPRQVLARRTLLRGLATGKNVVRGSSLPLRHIERLIDALAANGHRSQRELSQELGIALGLTNQLLQLLLGAGWIRSLRQTSAGRRVTYKPTRHGIEGGRHLARLHLQACGRSYEELRGYLSQRLTAIAVATGASSARLALIGDASLVEIACVSAPAAIVLVGVVDEQPRTIGQVPGFLPSALDENRLAGQPFDRIVIMSFDDAGAETALLRTRRVPPDLIECL